MEITALEMIAIAAREGRYCDPRDPRGSRGGWTYADICMALGNAKDRWGADMALMIGTRDPRNADKAKAVVSRYVREECERRREKADKDRITVAVERAISDAIYSSHREFQGSRYYELAIRFLMSRAEAAAGEAIGRRLVRQEAA